MIWGQRLVFKNNIYHPYHNKITTQVDDRYMYDLRFWDCISTIYTPNLVANYDVNKIIDYTLLTFSMMFSRI